jgi:AraC-like DNA-binding protein
MKRPKLLWITFGSGVPDESATAAFARSFELTQLAAPVLDEHDPHAEWDAVCCDFDYPDISGLRLIQLAKSRWPSVPIVMLTVQSSIDLALWALRSRVFDLLVKPASLDEVERLVERLLGAIRARRTQMERTPHSTAAPLPAEARYHFQPRAAQRLQAAISYVNKNFLHAIPKSEVALLCNMSPSRFCREFKSAFGMTYGEYLVQFRMAQAKRLLANPTMPVADVAGAVGFADPSYFTRVFRRQEGISPSEYRATTVFEADDVQSAAAG